MNKNVMVAILGVMLAASVGGNAYLFSKKSEAVKAAKEVQTVTTLKDSMQMALQKMEDSLRPLLTNYQEENSRLTGKIEELEGEKNPKVAELLAQVSSLRSQLSRSGTPGVSSGGASLSKADQKKLEEYRKMLEAKQKEIAELMAKIEGLTKERDEAVAQVQAEKDGKAGLERDNADMKDRITRGSIPQFGTLLTNGIQKKGDQQVESTKAKNIDRLKISFDVLDNPLIKETVEEEVTIRIIGPEGEVLATGNKNLADKSSLYCLKQTIISDGEMHKVRWWYPASGSLAGKLKKGKYSTELWSRGLLKQKNTFELD
jgi:hypothetical protein